MEISKKELLDEVLNKNFGFNSGNDVMNNTSEIKANKTTDQVSSIVNQRYDKYSPFFHGYFFYEGENKLKENLLPSGKEYDSLDDTSLNESTTEIVNGFIESVNGSVESNYEKYLILKDVLEGIKTEDHLLDKRLIKTLNDNSENLIKES